jgi:glycerate 2-kinase
MNLRRDAMRIFKAALAAADPEKALLTHVRRTGSTLIAGKKKYQLHATSRIYVVGAGKACGPMARAIETLLGSRISDSCVVVKDGHTVPLKRIQLVEASHPVPDSRGVAAAERIATLAAQARKQDLVICLISGGASALTPLPAWGLTLADKQNLTKQLLAAGANINEMNAVRKHFSQIKGGQLARLAAPAQVLTLILSDVIGDDLSTIGSGPTAPDPTTWSTVQEIFARFQIRAELPTARKETPKPGDPIFRRVQNLIIGSNAQSVEAASVAARQLGYRPLILSTAIDGETREIARMHAAIAKEVKLYNRPVREPACILSGGETTVAIRGQGLGGRNQEFALAAALQLQEHPGILAFSAGTDGTDGPTDAAGGFADSATAQRIAAAGLNPRAELDANNSYHALKAAGDLLITGPTKTNVMDIRMMLVATALKPRTRRRAPRVFNA